MTKLHERAEHLWYRITSAPNQTGRPMRYYVLECRCGRTISLHANTLTNDRMRKYFTRNGWDVGRTITQHRCPGCKNRGPIKTADRAAPPMSARTPQPSRLEAAWAAASNEEQAAFLQKMFGHYPVMQPNGKEPEPPSPEPEPELEPIEDEAPADWWVEMERKAGSS